ncbi:MAG: hypothetical protein PSV17_02020 [Methylotenera sp.]|uniref:hypothetical protein n=1 Tax=Methylotenera sp. TaxID=2051956 RepID=UPI0024898956|nr:hypothetical protein [Methylotenera sp.]MDI1308197.1 hypothetical protein [Methylotenera sp.]
MFRKLNGASVNFVTLAVIGGVLFAAYKLHVRLIDSHTWFVLLSIALTFSLFAAIFNYWRLLKITEAPISTIAAAAQGYIELHGVATTLKPFKTPYHGIPCVWYQASVYANRVENPYSKKVVDNRLLEYSESDTLFQLKDESGTCMVNPKGAEIIYFEKRTFVRNEHRYVEEFLPAGKRLYVLGQLDTRHDQVDSEVINKEVRNILADLKTRPQQLLNRYDYNRSGEIDMDEWELARQDAIKQAHAKYAMKAHTGSFTLVKPNDEHLFLISAQAPHELTASYRMWAIAHLLIFTILLLAFIKLA